MAQPTCKIQLTGKTAFVTGAASGIGESIARCFASAGADVRVADLNIENAENVAASIREANGRASSLAFDVTNEEQCKAVAAEFTPDILVNNAGVGAVGTILETSGADMDRMYAVNVRGVFNVTQAFLPGMLERKSGNIINLASVGGLVGIRDRFAYVATKFAVVGMTKALALDHADANIRANCICPGRVETPFVKARLAEYPDPEKAYKEMASTQLFGRMIQPEEIAATALFLAADESFMITGSALSIDCGWTAGL
ncbi:MAG: SDR family NAD(P)-dependent oxidoreductase [Chthoniobacterales bacterium]